MCTWRFSGSWVWIHWEEVQVLKNFISLFSLPLRRLAWWCSYSLVWVLGRRFYHFQLISGLIVDCNDATGQIDIYWNFPSGLVNIHCQNLYLWMLWLWCREPRGFGFVQFVDPADAADAKYELDGQVLLGRELTVVFAEENRKRPEEMRARDSSRLSSLSLNWFLVAYFYCFAKLGCVMKNWTLNLYKFPRGILKNFICLLSFFLGWGTASIGPEIFLLLGFSWVSNFVEKMRSRVDPFCEIWIQGLE